MNCPKCNAPVQEDWKYCPRCKTPLDGVANEPETVVDASGTLRNPDLVAWRTGPVRGNEVVVEEGTRALLLADGRLARTLPPGRHVVSGFLDRLVGRGPRTVDTVYVRTTDLEFEFSVGPLRTIDQVPFAARIHLVIRIDQPDLFFSGVLQGRRTIDRGDLQRILEPELSNAFAEGIGRIEAAALRGDLATKQQLEIEVSEHIRRTFGRLGMELVQFRTLSLAQPEMDETRELRGQKVLRDARLDAEQEALATDHREVDVILERHRVLSRLREAVNSRKMDEIRSEEDLADFLHEIDKKRVLREHEMDEFVRTFAENKEDHELARAHLLMKLSEERKAELAKLQQEHAHDLDSADLEHEIRKQMRLVDAEVETDRKRFLAALEQSRAAREAEHEQDVKEAMDGLRILDQMKRSQIDRQAALDEVELRRKEREHQLEIERLRVEAELRAAEVRAEAEARATEVSAYKGLTEEQILAIKAAETPEIARALEAKFRNEEKERLQQEMLERSDRHMDEFRKFAQEALRSQQETARGVAQGGRPVVGGFGANTPAAVIVCPRCRYQMDAATNPRHCPNCGQDLQP